MDPMDSALTVEQLAALAAWQQQVVDRLTAQGNPRAAFIAAMTPRTAWEVLQHAADVGLQQAWAAGDVNAVLRMLTALPDHPTQT